MLLLLLLGGNETSTALLDQRRRGGCCRCRQRWAAVRDGSRAGRRRGRGVAAPRPARARPLPHADARRHAARRDDPGEGEGDGLLRVGEPRRGGVRRRRALPARPRPRRRPASPQLRLRRALLPGCRAGPAGGAHHAASGCVERLPRLRLAGAPERIVPFNLWGRRTLPVEW